MANTIDITKLKRERIKETFFYEGEHIYVYNPTQEQRKELTIMLLNNLNLETNEVELDDMKITLKVFKELTNLSFPTDEKKLIEVFEDPNDLLIDVQMSLEEILFDLTEKIIKNMKIISKFYKNVGLNTEQIAEILVNKSHIKFDNPPKDKPIKKTTSKKKKTSKIKETKVDKEIKAKKEEIKNEKEDKKEVDKNE